MYETKHIVCTIVRATRSLMYAGWVEERKKNFGGFVALTDVDALAKHVFKTVNSYPDRQVENAVISFY